MIYLSFLLAWRYLCGSRNTTIGTMLKVCFIGIYLSTTALALVTFIMEGFEKQTHATLKGVHADIIMDAGGQHIDFTSVQKVLVKEFPEIIGCSPSDLQQGLIKSQYKHEAPTVVMIKGIDPDKEKETSALESLVQTPKKTLPEILSPSNSILIGHRLAQFLGAPVGSYVELLVTTEESTHKNSIQLKPYKVFITGIFKTGIEELDSSLIISSLTTLESLIPDAGVTSIHLNCAKTTNEVELIRHLKKRFGLHVHSWKDLYPALVAALALEKYTMIIVLGLMVLIASMSIFSLLFMLITTKRADIAILQAMGFSQKYCAAIFIIVGLIISLTAALAGLMTALLVGILLQKYPIIKLPDAYFVSQLPIVIQPYMCLMLFIFILIISVYASYLAARLSKNISIVQLLRKT